MKKATLALLFSLTISIVNYGQVELKTGQPYKVVKATDKWYFQNTKNIIAIKFSRKKITLQTIDKVSLTETAMNIIDELPKGYVFEFMVELDNRLYMLSSIRDKKNDVEQLFSQEINIDNATFKGDPKLILSVEGRIFFGDYYSSQYVHKFNFQTSFDKSKLLITYRRKPEEKKDAKSYDIIGLNVFEKDMKNFSSQEITMPYTEKKMDNLDYTVDSEGNTYSLAKVYNDNTTDDKKRSKDTESNYHMELFKIKYKTNKIQVIQIELAGKFIKDLWIVETAQKDIMCAGYYNNGATSGLNLGFRSLKVGSSGVDGVVLLKVSNDGIVSNMSSHEIPLEIMNQYVSLRRQKKNAKKDDKDKLELTDLKFKNLQINPDGSTVLIGEKEYVVAHTYTHR